MEELLKENFSCPMSVDNEFNDLIISDFTIISPYILKQTNKLFNEILDSINNIETFIDKLITLLIRVHDKEGYNFIETNQFVDQCIILFNQTSDSISNWLIKNQTKSQYIFFLGFLYFNGIIVGNGVNEAFKLFSKASENNYSIAQVYLGKCYQAGIGIKPSSYLAITCLYNAIKNDSIYGQLYLGNLYENSIVTLNQAFYWYEKAANNGNLNGLYYLGNCYQFGKGIEKNENKAFEIYKKLAEQENVKALFALGYCYNCGIGTDINNAKAFDLYKIAAEEGNNNVAQN